MTKCIRSRYFFRNRKQRRDRVLRKMATMRAAKARKRLDNPLEPEEARGAPFYPLQIGVRDKLSGEVSFVDFRSVRDAAKRLALVQKFYIPGCGLL
jgi:hypothetical protein